MHLKTGAALVILSNLASAAEAPYLFTPAADVSQANRIADGLRAAGCPAPEIVPDDTLPAPGRVIIAIGNAPEDRLLRRLYFEEYDFADFGSKTVAYATTPPAVGVPNIVVETQNLQTVLVGVNYQFW